MFSFSVGLLGSLQSCSEWRGFEQQSEYFVENPPVQAAFLMMQLWLAVMRFRQDICTPRKMNLLCSTFTVAVNANIASMASLLMSNTTMSTTTMLTRNQQFQLPLFVHPQPPVPKKTYQMRGLVQPNLALEEVKTRERTFFQCKILCGRLSCHCLFYRFPWELIILGQW